MSIRKTLLMLTVNYILIFAWIFWYRMGVLSALIIFPLTMGAAFFDTVMAEGRMSAYLWCGNLLIATIAGILLQTYIIVRETGDIGSAFLRAAVEIPVAVLIIGIVAVISGYEAAKLKKKRRLTTAAPSSEDMDERYSYGERSSFRSSMGFRDVPELEDDYDPDDYDPDDEDDLPEEEDDEPKFRVIRKS